MTDIDKETDKLLKEEIDKIELKNISVSPEVFKINKEEEESILQKAKCTDLIEKMICRNCASCIMENGKLYCKEKVIKAELLDDKTKIYSYEETKLNEHCSFWSENINKKEDFKAIYYEIIEVIKYFLDLKEEDYSIIALWIIGTYFHDTFETYPYLFINAMRGSGKTRLLKLIKELSKDGDMLASLSEAVLFRTTGTLCIDEFERIGSKEKSALRELLNTAYKKGGKVKRMRKVKIGNQERQEVEEFNTFRPIVMANISGLEEVLGDRCITLTIEKSDQKDVTLKIENFSENYKIKKIKEKLRLYELFSVDDAVLCGVYGSRSLYEEWNKYITILYTTHTTHTTQDTLNTQTTQTEVPSFFEKLIKSEIDGRNLEITFPLLMIAENLEIFDIILEIFKSKVNEKKEEEVIESKDVTLYDFVSRQFNTEFYKVKELTTSFRQMVDDDPEEEPWLNPKWMGRALKRLNLVLQKRRMGAGIEVILNIGKAKTKLKIFKREPPPQNI